MDTAILQLVRVNPVVRTCAFVGKLRLTDVEDKDRIDLLETLKGTTELQISYQEDFTM